MVSRMKSYIEHGHDGMAKDLAEKIGKRTGTNPMTDATVTQRGPTRRCSYCKHQYGAHRDEGLGHTRRTCKDLKAATVTAARVNGLYREGILESFRHEGIGVGTLLSMSVSGYFPAPETGEEKWGRREVTVMVRRIEWDAINYVDAYAEPIIVQRMDKMGTSDVQTMSLPQRFRDNDRETYGASFDIGTGEWGPYGMRVGQWCPQVGADNGGFHAINLLARVPSECVRPPSDDWLNGQSDALTKHFNSLKG
jgi:hypothetical protein